MNKTSLLATLFILSITEPMLAQLYENRDGIKLELSEQDYDLWLEKDDDITDLQTGVFRKEGESLHFFPEKSDIGDLKASKAKIVDECTILWNKYGLFHRKECKEARDSTNLSTPLHSSSVVNRAKIDFPKKWVTFRKNGITMQIPKGSRVSLTKNRISVEYGKGKWELFETDDFDTYLRETVAKLHPEYAYRSKEGNSIFLQVEKPEFRYVMVVKKRAGKRTLIGRIEASDQPTFKAMSISMASYYPLKTDKPQKAFKPLPLVHWKPSDGSFRIDIPKGWQTDGGTADLGVNGYIRIVRAVAPDEKAGFIGVYYPFYQYMETPYGPQGTPPMEPENYLRQLFFNELASKYRIEFEGLEIKKVTIDKKLSDEFTKAYQNLYRQQGVLLQVSNRVLTAVGTFVENGETYDMLVTGLLNYNIQTIQSIGNLYRWGPAPLFIEVAAKGQLLRYLPTFKKMAGSFQVDREWLAGHMQKADAEMKSIIKHYRKMSDIIHKNSEERIKEGLEEYESEEQEKMEEHWDTFFALGGEERYNDPVTGEEIDLPYGVDRYYYDRYSQVWVGINESRPDAEELAQHLKEEGFVELRLHTH